MYHNISLIYCFDVEIIIYSSFGKSGNERECSLISRKWREMPHFASLIVKLTNFFFSCILVGGYNLVEHLLGRLGKRYELLKEEKARERRRGGERAARAVHAELKR